MIRVEVDLSQHETGNVSGFVRLTGSSGSRRLTLEAVSPEDLVTSLRTLVEVATTELFTDHDEEWLRQTADRMGLDE